MNLPLRLLSVWILCSAFISHGELVTITDSTPILVEYNRAFSSTLVLSFTTTSSPSSRGSLPTYECVNCSLPTYIDIQPATNVSVAFTRPRTPGTVRLTSGRYDALRLSGEVAGITFDNAILQNSSVEVVVGGGIMSFLRGTIVSSTTIIMLQTTTAPSTQLSLTLSSSSLANTSILMGNLSTAYVSITSSSLASSTIVVFNSTLTGSAPLQVVNSNLIDSVLQLNNVSVRAYLSPCLSTWRPVAVTGSRLQRSSFVLDSFTAAAVGYNSRAALVSCAIVAVTFTGNTLVNSSRALFADVRILELSTNKGTLQGAALEYNCDADSKWVFQNTYFVFSLTLNKFTAVDTDVTLFGAIVTLTNAKIRNSTVAVIDGQLIASGSDLDSSSLKAVRVTLDTTSRVTDCSVSCQQLTVTSSTVTRLSLQPHPSIPDQQFLTLSGSSLANTSILMGNLSTAALSVTTTRIVSSTIVVFNSTLTGSAPLQISNSDLIDSVFQLNNVSVRAAFNLCLSAWWPVAVTGSRL
jgi:hypothetical protein